MVRQVFFSLFLIPDRVQQERATFLKSFQYIVHMDVCRYVTSHEIRSSNQISRTDRTITETQVRSRKTAWFLWIVSKISLTIFIGSSTDNFDRIFVRPDRTIGSQPIKFSFISSGRSHFNICFSRQRTEGNVIFDTDRKLVFRFVTFHIFVNGNNLRRSNILRSHTVTSTYDHRSISLTIEDISHIQIQRITVSSRFFGTV